MSSTVQSSATPINAAIPKSASPSAASSNNARSSYASATKGQQASPSANAGSGSPAAVGGLALSQHAHKPSASPVNGRPTAPPSAPTGPAIVSSSTNGTPAHGDHTRTPSVTISAQGANGNVANGFATPARPPIAFGSIGASPSPSMSHSTPHMHHNSLSSHYGGPNPARSPSPIPPPAVSSGGRPPSSLAGQNPVNFGSLPGADGSDQSLPLRPGIPSGPGAGPQAQHLRRESSQSAHSDNLNRNFTPNGRGSGNRAPFNTQQFPGGAQAAHSPSMFRPGLAMNRQQSNVPPFQHQVRGANSPYQANRSPMPPHAQPHMANMPNGGPMGYQHGYPPHMSQTPIYMPQDGYYPQYPFQQQAGFMPGPNMYQPPHPSMSLAPPSQFRAQQPYVPGPYPSPGPQSMSRQASQSGDPRPSSSMGHSPGPHGPQASPSPGPAQSSFQRPPKKSSAIRITNAEGVEIDLKKSVQSPVTATPAKGPAVISSGGVAPAVSTPPRNITPSTQQHVRTESIQTKSAEERKREFQEAFQKQLEAEKAAQKEKDKPVEEVKEEPAPKVEEKVEETKSEPEPEPEPEAPAEAGETEEERKKREEAEEMERMIAEMEEEARLEEEREKAYEAERQKKKEAEKAKAAERAANEEEEMKRLEKEAEEREEAKAKGKTDGDSDAEAANLFSQLKKNTMFGPGASAASGTPASEASTPGSESPMPPPAQPASATKTTPTPAKNKPAALKLETTKAIEPAQPTAGMQALKTARFLEVKNDAINYPEGIKSPNPALNQGTKGRGQRYDNDFLLQFREVFREKPSIDWDKTIKETVGDGADSARPGSARTPSMGGRSMSGRPGAPQMGGMMGSFQGGRTLPQGTTSEQRFQASNLGPGSRPGMPGFPGSFPAGRGAPFPMGAPGMVRTPSAQNMPGMNSPRNASHRGKGSRRGGPNPAQEAEMQKKMPLTAGMSIAPLEVSQTGWKPTNLGQGATGAALPSGHLAPDMVQRKVKAALNKMTPEKFDKISGDILLIASQSKDETDGRTLRQVIQLTFEKACDEAHWSSMYAKFCERMLQDMGPEIRDEGVKDKHGQVVVGGALFRKYLLNRCQEEFERGWEVNLPERPEGQTEEAAMLSDEYYIAAAAKRRGLGLIQFIGELYKLGMLTLRIMHECVVKLLNFEGTPDETAIESLVKLLRTIGATMDNDPTGKGRTMMDTYIERINTIMKIEGLPSRMYYMLLDTTELRKKNWISKDTLKGPKTITEIREEAAAAQTAAEIERQRSSRGGPGGRMPAGRGDARSFSGGGMPAPDYKSSSVAMDDLKKLTRNARTNPSGSGGLGPGSLLSNSRSGSRRGGLGPKMGDDSAGSSRTNTPPVKDKESTAHVNAYSALAALDGDHPDDVASPPSQHASPAVTKAQPAAAGGEAESK